MTIPSLDTSNPASVASGQPLACSSTLTSNSTHDLCLTQTIAVTNNASISIVTVIKTTQCDLFITGLDCGLCDVDKPHIRVPTVLLRVSALDPATTRAFTPADVTDGSVPQTLPYSASPIPFFSQPTIQQTTIWLQVTQPTQVRVNSRRNRTHRPRVGTHPFWARPLGPLLLLTFGWRTLLIF